MPTEDSQSDSVPTKPGKEPPKGEFSDTVAFRLDTSVEKRATEIHGVMNVAASSAAPAAACAAPPPVFGRYEVRRTLGTGGFGAVYLGHDSQLDRPVAIKVLHAGPVRSPTESDQSLLEARKLAKLRHPGIVTVHDVGVHDGQVYIVSDFLDGPDLDRWLSTNRPTWPEAARIAAAVADALAHAHARLIVHRDVKPANILFTADRQPVLVDFGLALDEGQAGGGAKGIVSGTPSYMSPEQVSGTAHRIDGRTDIYSLGVVLYEMLTGRVPFAATTPVELFRQVLDDEPQPPRQIVHELPLELERACLKALAKREQDRYTTAADFAEDLRRVLGSSAERPGSQHLTVELPTRVPGLTSTDLPHTRTHSSLSSSTSRRVREAERRQVTVLVCGGDLFESEAYVEGLDAEDQAKLLHAFQQACEQAVHGFDGTVVQCTEQGLLACFGYPVAHEDAARRAVRGGLEIIERSKVLGEQLQREHKLELNPWVGIHTGLAVVETKDGVVSLVGEARNVAIRMGDSAVPGQVICTEATERLIRGHIECEDLGRQKLKGVAQPVALFGVQGIGQTRSPFEAAAPAALTPLTGRDLEVSLLKERWEQAQEGMGQVVQLAGEAGLGKSRLVHTLKEHVLGQMVEGEVDAPVIEWRCSPHFQNTGLYPAIDFYERALGFGREEPQVRFERLVHRLEQYDLATPEAVPLWASLLSLPLPVQYPAMSLSPVRQREEMFRLMLEWLHTRAARKPILFIVEDLHWADASTLEFLGQLLAEGMQDTLMILLACRPEFKAPWPAVAGQTTLALNRLTRRQVGDLMRTRTQGHLSEAVVEQIYDRTAGVPLFVEEFTKMAQESGLLDPAAAPSDQAFLGREIPATLQDLVMARLDRMGSERELAQLAATLGREFSHEVLATVAGLDEPTLQAELAKLVQAEILYPKGRSPRCSYTFKHALLEDALYNSLVKERRQHYHQRIGDALEAQFPQTAEHQPELLGHHFAEAGLTEKAIGYWLRAAQQSQARSADCETIGHLTKSLALLATLPETRERDEWELQFLTALAPAYIAARGYAAPEVGPTLLRARELCQRIGAPQQLFGIMLGMWEWRLVRGDLRPCVDLAADGMTFARQLDDPGILMEALLMPGATSFYRGQFADARASCEKAVTDYDDRQRTKFWTAYTGHNAGITQRCYLALALWHLGYPDQALELDRQTRELARSIGHAFSLGHAVDFAACLAHYCRFAPQLEAAADEEIAIGKEQGFQIWHALGTIHKGAGMLLQGRPADALPVLLKGFKSFRATGAELRVPYYFGVLGDAYTQSAAFADAHKALEDGLAAAEKNDDRFQEAELYRLSGELLLAESHDLAGAEECFARALKIARQQQSRAWELRSTMSLARLWQRQGRHADARTALAAVYGAYTEGFTTPDLVVAKSLLDSLA